MVSLATTLTSSFCFLSRPDWIGQLFQLCLRLYSAKKRLDKLTFGLVCSNMCLVQLKKGNHAACADPFYFFRLGHRGDSKSQIDPSELVCVTDYCAIEMMRFGL